jgi:glycosyltransferase involved in cell wall biosynthesis
MTNPSISVILPVYNGAAFLGEAVRSVAAQTFADWECIVVDDGSEDGSAEVAASAAGGDPRIKIVSFPHRGLVAALNAGLGLARAPLAARMDADDVSMPERLERQVGLMRARPEITVCGCLVRSFPAESAGEGMLYYEDWLNSLVKECEILRDFFVESPFAHPSVVFRKDAVDRLGGYLNLGWPEDYDLWMRLFLSGARFAKVPEVLYLWRDYPDRLSRTHRMYSLPRFKKMKAHYLLQSYLKGRGEVTVWGAGRYGRWWCRELLEAGIRTARFIDIDPKKIGRPIGETPVVPPDALRDRTPGEFIVGAVGTRGARELIRTQLLGFGYVELENFIFVA